MIDEEAVEVERPSQAFPRLLTICALSGVTLGAAMVFFSLSFSPVPSSQLPESVSFTSSDIAHLSLSLVKVDQPAPDFTLTSLNDEEVTLSHFRGRPILINFWATWCVPCRTEMPELVQAYERYAESGLVILAINQTQLDSLQDVAKFVKEFEVSFPVLLDEASHVSTDLYGLLGLPMSIFVNAEGYITRIHVGILSKAQLDEFIVEMLDGE